MEAFTEVGSTQEVFAEEAFMEVVSTEVLPVVGAAAAGDGVDRL